MFSLVDFINNYRPAAEDLDKIGILDIGAMLIEGRPVEYSVLLNQKCARVVGFEPAKEECQKLNAVNQSAETRFLPYFIGDGTRQKFYHTNFAMTGSLYEPNTQLLNMFHNLGELTQVVSEEMVDTVRLDDIPELNFSIDYVKIDVQGAELQVFNGARDRVLKDVLVIQTEVEWVPLYKNQPLFSELEIFLRNEGFIVHRTLGHGTRCFKPLIMNNNINIGMQQLWSDVVFVRDFTRLDVLKPHQLLKMAIILHEVYQSFDLSLILLQEYDRQRQSELAQSYQKQLTGEKSLPQTVVTATAPSQETNANDFVTTYSRGVESYTAGNYALALDCFETARTIKSDFAPLWHNLSLTKARMGRTEAAITDIDQAIALDPNYQDAIELRKLLSTFLPARPAHSEVFTADTVVTEKLHKALELQQQGKLAEAETEFQEVLAANPQSIPALFSLGGIEQNRQNPTKALAYFKRAIAIKPDYPPLWYNLGVILQSLKQFDEAISSYDKAIAIDPVYTEALLNRGTVLVEMKRHKDALLNYERLLKIDPANDKALCNRGIILTDFKLNELAIETFAKLLEVSPDYNYAAGLLCFAKMHACSWNNLQPLADSIIEGVRAGKRVCKSLAFTAISGEPRDHLCCAEIFARHFCPAQQPLWRGERYNHHKIKIAYISPDFREHPVGHLIAGVFELHDKNRFEIIAVSLGIDDRSPLRQRMLAAFDEFIDARNMRSQDIATLLREMEIEILVDLAGYTADARPDVAAFRPAPVQVNYLGYSSTMGAEYIDYIIADRHIIPEEYRDCYSEKVVYLPDTYLPTDSAVQIAEKTLSRKEYGLPESGFVFCSFNHDYKINPPIFDVWMRLLHKVAGSVLWLMKLNEEAEKNLRREAESRGVAPDRIIFATRIPRIEDHLARYRAADLFLDTTPCNAHSTASDVLRTGLPLITCRGKAFPGRVAAGLLNVVGLPELVTETLVDYEKLALKLATDKKALNKIRKKLAENLKTTPLFDTLLYCRNLEHAYSEMYARHQREESPAHIAVEKVHPQSEKPEAGTSTNKKSDSVTRTHADSCENSQLRLHIGGKEVKPGWKILNIQKADGVDYVGDIKDLSQFPDEMFDMIYGSHVLEHVPQFQMVQTLAGMNRILKPDGKLFISVPDLEVLCKMFLKPELDKAARFHIMRMMFGGQVDQHDFHQIGLTSEILMDYLGAANFKFCKRVDEFGLFNDTSSYKPYGVQISLNLIAYKVEPKN